MQNMHPAATPAFLIALFSGCVPSSPHVSLADVWGFRVGWESNLTCLIFLLNA